MSDIKVRKITMNDVKFEKAALDIIDVMKETRAYTKATIIQTVDKEGNDDGVYQISIEQIGK